MLPTERAILRFARVCSWAQPESAWRTGQEPAGADLLSRSVDLLPADSEERADLLVELGTALKFGGDRARARVVLCEAIETARSTRNARAEWLARIELAEVNIHVDPPGALPGRAALPRPRSMHSRTLLATTQPSALGCAGYVLRTSGRWHRRGAPRAHMRVAPGTSRRKQASASLPALGIARDIEEAMQELAPYLAWARERGNASLEVFLLARQGLLSARAGRFDQARATSGVVARLPRNLGWTGFCPTALGKKASSSTLRASIRPRRSCAPLTMNSVGAERVLTLRRSPLSLARCCIGRSGSTRPRNSVELARTWRTSRMSFLNSAASARSFSRERGV